MRVGRVEAPAVHFSEVHGDGQAVSRPGEFRHGAPDAPDAHHRSVSDGIDGVTEGADVIVPGVETLALPGYAVPEAVGEPLRPCDRMVLEQGVLSCGSWRDDFGIEGPDANHRRLPVVDPLG